MCTLESVRILYVQTKLANISWIYYHPIVVAIANIHSFIMLSNGEAKIIKGSALIQTEKYKTKKAILMSIALGIVYKIHGMHSKSSIYIHFTLIFIIYIDE